MDDQGLRDMKLACAALIAREEAIRGETITPMDRLIVILSSIGHLPLMGDMRALLESLIPLIRKHMFGFGILDSEQGDLSPSDFLALSMALGNWIELLTKSGMTSADLPSREWTNSVLDLFFPQRDPEESN